MHGYLRPIKYLKVKNCFITFCYNLVKCIHIKMTLYHASKKREDVRSIYLLVCSRMTSIFNGIKPRPAPTKNNLLGYYMMKIYLYIGYIIIINYITYKLAAPTVDSMAAPHQCRMSNRLNDQTETNPFLTQLYLVDHFAILHI